MAELPSTGMPKSSVATARDAEHPAERFTQELQGQYEGWKYQRRVEGESENAVGR